MAKLIYLAITSLDGYIADEDGNLDWAEPDEEVHTFSSTTSSDRSAPTSTGAGCTR
jgi:dihydrofolate reductase